MTKHEPMERNQQPCIPITDFTYDAGTRTFRYRPTGDVWKRASVDVVVAPVRHEGVTMKATEWLERFGDRQ